MPPVVIVRPLSGYANRLQAIVSSGLLAEELEAELLVCWEESDVAPVPATVVLDAEYCAGHVRSAQEIAERFGVDPTAMPQYLAVDLDAGVITVAGLDLGEQHFMPPLRNALAGLPDARAVVLSAGGKFTLHGDAVLTDHQERAFRNRRALAYQQLTLHQDVEERAGIATQSETFVGLHLRYSDRSAQTPWRRDVAPALGAVAGAVGATSVFVASDTAVERRRWSERVQGMGLTPWSNDPGDYARSDPRSALGALVDWRILTRSRAMVYFEASSFAEEACVASGHFDQSVGLKASGTRTTWVRAGQYIEAARTYPRRHQWWGNS